MIKNIIFILLSGIPLYTSAMIVQETYPRWVQNATKIYVYSKKGKLMAEMPINNGSQVTINDIRQYLLDQDATNDQSRYDLCPLHNQWWRFGYWIRSEVKIGSGNIKKYMEQHNTASFWMQNKPISIKNDNDEEN